MIKAIDEEVSLQPEEVLADLSILDRSFLDKVDLDTLPLPSSWGYPPLRARTDARTMAKAEDEAAMWRERTRTLRRDYERRIDSLEEQLRERNRDALAESQATRLKTEREKWKHVNRILNNYFDEYNIRI